ncbi:hypothetical protein AcV7_005132 [Taiwanofungus camphoratus]|nr:hypothetical protein AcV7_005132 [Antrodia cinnamomea]
MSAVRVSYLIASLSLDSRQLAVAVSCIMILMRPNFTLAVLKLDRTQCVPPHQIRQARSSLKKAVGHKASRNRSA